MQKPKENKPEQIILGVDPGTTVMGYALLRVKDNNLSLISMGVIELHKFKDHFKKLKIITDRICQIIDHYHPDELAIEAPFYGKNVQSMLKLGRAQGAVISLALQKDIPVMEYAPRKIKMAITGNGNASKEQVAYLLQKLLHSDFDITNLDASDALGAAVCHHFQGSRPNNTGNHFNSWKDFINKNPSRIKN